MTAETPKQKEPQRVETTMVAPVETTEAAEAEATTESTQTVSLKQNSWSFSGPPNAPKVKIP